MKSTLLARAAAVLALAALPAAAAEIDSSVDPAALSEKKITELGLYLTAEDAHDALTDDPSIVFIDVRDPHEMAFIGHPLLIDRNVPRKLRTMEFVEKKGTYGWKDNPDFAAEVERVMQAEGLGKDAPVIVMCRSGGRSAMAADALAKAGFTRVWNLVDGFEGGKNEDGVRNVNGWRNAGLPWAYKIDPAKVWRPASE
jgi:rhodanese-related sulfurtransferase